MKDQRIVLFLFLCLTTGSNSQAPGPACSDPNQQLQNMVVYEGNASSFSNKLDPNNVKWEIAPSFDPSGVPAPPYLVADDNITPYPDVYTVTSTQLGIPKASIFAQGTDPYSTSGLYTLTYKADGCQALANLIVVTKGPLCTCSATDSVNAQVTCEMEFGVARILPNYVTMTWYDNSGNKVSNDTSSPNQDQPNYDIATSSYGITSSGAATYKCVVTFEPPDTTVPNMATNAPDFTASCTVANCAKTIETTPIEGTSTTTTEPTTASPQPTTTTTIDLTTATPQNCLKDLINIVVYEGSVAEFENVDDGKPVKWHFSSSSDPENNLLDITDYDNKVNRMFVGAYNVTKTKLTILSATVAPKGRNPYANAGVYFLTYQSTGCQSAANLIVIQSGPMCERNGNDPNNVTLSCNISFAESQRQPSYPTMTWTAGTVVIRRDNPTTQKYAYVNESLSQIHVYNAAPSYYQCQVTFNPPGPSPISFLAQNSPSYTESCTVAPGTFPPTTEIATTTAGTFPPTTEIATTTVCVDRPTCSSKWLSSQTAFCQYVREFRDDCPAFCLAC